MAHDPGCAAAWKACDRALAGAGRAEEAIDACRLGIEAAESKGDIQAAQEMRVFRRRLEKAGSPTNLTLREDDRPHHTHPPTWSSTLDREGRRA